MTTVFGEVSWNDDLQLGNDKKKEMNKDLWLRLSEGSNVVRLLTSPFQYSVHKGIKKEGEKGYGRKLKCSIIHGSCPLCAAGSKPGQRWLLGVLEKKTGAYRILDVSYQVFSQIRKLARKTDVWGDPTKYDIDIVVDQNGGPTGYYSVQPIPHKPLTPQEQSVRDNDVNLDEIKKQVQPFTPEVVQKILDKMLDGGKLSFPAQKENVKPSKADASASSSDMSDSDAVDEIFPPYDGSTAS